MRSDETGMVLFRNSHRGYDRQDVNRYIEEMNARFKEENMTLSRQVALLEERLAGAEKAQGDPALLSALTAGKQTAEKQCAALREAVDRLTAEKEALETELASCKAAGAGEAAAPAGNAAVPDADTYEAVSRKLGSILLDARMEAERIVAEAEKTAAARLAKAEEEAESVRFAAAIRARRMNEEARRQITAYTGQFVQGMDSLIRSAADAYGDTLREIGNAGGQLLSTLH